MDSRQQVVERNYTVFKNLLPTLLPANEGKHALMADGAIVDLFDTARDAQIVGKRLYPNGEWSIQEVTGTPVNLGFWSYA